jgi:2Fe-2S ferredoxin
MKVKFVPQNIEIEIRPNQSVMHLAHENGIYIKSVCKGLPSCAECRVRVVDHEHNVLPPLAPELALVGSGHFIDGRRLSCQLRCFGDVTVDLTEQVEKEKNAKAGKKLKGGRPSDSMESFAVRGNLIEDESAAMAEVTSEANARGEQRRGGQSGRDHSPDGQRNLRGRNDRGQSGQQQGERGRDQRGGQPQGRGHDQRNQNAGGREQQQTRNQGPARGQGVRHHQGAQNTQGRPDQRRNPQGQGQRSQPQGQNSQGDPNSKRRDER